MPTQTSSSRTSSSGDDVNPTGTYVLVLVVETLVITALYWLGRYFS